MSNDMSDGVSKPPKKSGLQSENLAGIASFAGSTIYITNFENLGAVLTQPSAAFNINQETASAALLFSFAELIFVRYGHHSWGYSLGMGFIGAGDAVIALASEDLAVKTSMGTKAVVFGIASLRCPFELAANATKELRQDISKAFTRTANNLPKVCGASILAIRTPALAASVVAQQWELATAVGLWATADILVGRLQDTVKSIFSGNRKDQPVMPEGSS